MQEKIHSDRQLDQNGAANSLSQLHSNIKCGQKRSSTNAHILVHLCPCIALSFFPFSDSFSHALLERSNIIILNEAIEIIERIHTFRIELTEAKCMNASSHFYIIVMFVNAIFSSIFLMQFFFIENDPYERIMKKQTPQG